MDEFIFGLMLVIALAACSKSTPPPPAPPAPAGAEFSVAGKTITVEAKKQ